MRKGGLLGLRRGDVNFSAVTLSRLIDGEVWDVRPGWPLIERSKSVQL